MSRLSRPLLTIDLDAVAANWRALDRRTPSGALTGAVAKADAYGLGVKQAAPALARAGARAFFVATAEEAVEIRDALGPGPSVTVLNGPTEGLGLCRAARARVCLNAPEDVEMARAFAARIGAPIDVALQIETGMNRLGVPIDALDALTFDGLQVTLILSHLACADTPADPANAAQKAAFDAALPALQRRFAGAKASLAATGGCLLGEGFAYDLTRPGVGLYGGAPFSAARPVVRLEAPIVKLWDAPAGTASGYGGAWRAERPSRLATVPIGYADGLPRAMSNRGEARIGERTVPFAGRVSMDLIVLDVTDAPEAYVGGVATLLDDVLTVDRMAAAAGTIGYEVLTGLGRRYARRYVGGATGDEVDA